MGNEKWRMENAQFSISRYPQMKDSGVAWIGGIPAGWEMRRLATLGEFSKGKGIPRSELKENGCPVILYGDIYTKYDVVADFIFNHISEETAQNSIRIRFGDILFTGSGETREDIGKSITYIGDESVCVGGDVIIFRHKCDHLFLSYSLNSNSATYQKARAGKGGIIVHIYSSNLREIVLPLPPLEEQTAVSHYLDYKTAVIDQLISQKEQLLALYEEEKGAIIDTAVTQGIHPTAKLKDSGIPWLSHIPAHWEVKKLKHVFRFHDYKRIPLSAEVRGKMLNKRYDYYGASGIIDSVEDFIFDGEYILLGEDGANLLTRNTALAFKATGRFWVNNHAHILTPATGSLDYFVHLLECIDYTNSVSGSAQPKLTAGALGAVDVIIPPIQEQTAIVQHIEAETARLNAKISKTKKLIALHKEYRTALISEVVTGKIKVTQEVAA
ncbi:Type I restriction-modification system, specificity subunit S [hydrothermal vent metagenome]|uniref:Type I restriction-modification system, specificity subunit S n=1 Tax=hydrothermal vent metagenome TaxID=652676 RepID=A0A3B0VG75_9ZZZZ